LIVEMFSTITCGTTLEKNLFNALYATRSLLAASSCCDTCESTLTDLSSANIA